MLRNMKETTKNKKPTPKPVPLGHLIKKRASESFNNEKANGTPSVHIEANNIFALENSANIEISISRSAAQTLAQVAAVGIIYNVIARLAEKTASTTVMVNRFALALRNVDVRSFCSLCCNW